MRRCTGIWLVILCLLTPASVITADAAIARDVIRPSARPVRWQLDFEPGDLRLYVDARDGKAYLFMTYKVVNNTSQDRLWAPSFVLFTDRGELVKSGVNVPRRITDELLTLMGNEFLETQERVIGDLFQGEGMAKEGLVIWPIQDTRLNELRIFVAGLSGETARLNHPITGEPIILRKTMQRNYLIRGDALARGRKPIELIGTTWVMR